MNTDTERLNWLAQRCYLPGDHPDNDILVVVSEKWSPLGSFSCNRENDNKALRAAIDKMMESERRESSNESSSPAAADGAGGAERKHGN